MESNNEGLEGNENDGLAREVQPVMESNRHGSDRNTPPVIVERDGPPHANRIESPNHFFEVTPPENGPVVHHNHFNFNFSNSDSASNIISSLLRAIPGEVAPALASAFSQIPTGSAAPAPVGAPLPTVSSSTATAPPYVSAASYPAGPMNVMPPAAAAQYGVAAGVRSLAWEGGAPQSPLLVNAGTPPATATPRRRGRPTNAELTQRRIDAAVAAAVAATQMQQPLYQPQQTYGLHQQFLQPQQAAVQPQQVPNVQPQQVPNLQPQQVPNVQPQQVANVQPQQVPNLQPQQVPNVQPQQVPNVQPQQVANVQPQNVQPHQVANMQPQQGPVECKICRRMVADSVISTCGHCVCRACVEHWLVRRPVCPDPYCNVPCQLSDVRRRQ